MSKAILNVFCILMVVSHFGCKKKEHPAPQPPVSPSPLSYAHGMAGSHFWSGKQEHWFNGLLDSDNITGYEDLIMLDSLRVTFNQSTLYMYTNVDTLNYVSSDTLNKTLTYYCHFYSYKHYDSLIYNYKTDSIYYYKYVTNGYETWLVRMHT
jgi:hypothetical protein